MKTLHLQKPDINYERLAFAALLSLVFMFAFGYLYFVNATVLHVVGRQDAEQRMSETRAHISELETTYFARIDGMDLDLAVSYGLQETEGVKFVSRKTLAKNLLTLNEF